MILIGTPSFSGSVTFDYMRSFLEMVKVCNQAGIGVGFEPLARESLITRARNRIAAMFLRHTEFSHLLFIDADIGFPADAALRFLRANRDVVCGIYPVKRLDVGRLRGLPDELPAAEAMAASFSYAVKLKATGGPVIDGLAPVEYGPAGFMMIKRGVLERMAGAYPELRYHPSCPEDGEGDGWAFFDTAIDRDNRDYLPEDYAFCKRWTTLGGEIYADVTSRFTHTGACDYPGDFPVYLRHAQAGSPRRGAAGREEDVAARPARKSDG